MTKRKRKRPQPIISKNEVGDTIISTGIYQRTIPAERKVPPAEVIQQLKAGFDAAANDIASWKRSVQRTAWSFLEPYCMPATFPLPDADRWPQGYSVRWIDRGDGPESMFVRNPQPTDVESLDALEILSHLDSMDQTPDDAEKLYYAFSAGRMFERLSIRGAEPRALAQRKASKSGNDKQSKAAAKRREEYRRAVAVEMKRQENYTTACEVVATRFNVSLRTVTNNVPNTWTSRRKR